ncbi:MAG: cytochrome c oxidase subunit 3 [Schleiferiaceae bacterium]|jgi:cytochrome c oxidase subunit 3|nr:cytochrome c oxidase subunit 3 [Schleiferiaceae bacterium]MDG2110426.1 cytochrome c oxidase subunit 3 [Schleiferiaceae bacterium]|tara:strand:+ start:327 stop:1247 length:921 start_codon:yes stop_codon:yes gene_type:complete
MASSAEMTQEENNWGGGSRPLGSRYGKLMMWFFLLSDALTFSGFLTAYGLMRFKFESTWPIAENVFTHFPGLEGDQPLLYVALMTFILIMSSVTMVLAVNAGEKMNRKAVTNWMLWTIVGGFIFVGSQAWEWYHFIIGDSGAVETARQEILHIYNEEGERLSFSQVIHGMEEGHASNHGEMFTKAEVLSAMKSNEGMYLMEPGKAGEAFTHERSVALLEAGDVVQGANMIHNEYGQKQFANFFFFITGFHGFHVFSGVVINFIIFYNVLLGTYERRGHYRMVEKVGLYWHFVDLVWVFVFTFFYLV